MTILMWPTILIKTKMHHIKRTSLYFQLVQMKSPPFILPWSRRGLCHPPWRWGSWRSSCSSWNVWRRSSVEVGRPWIALRQRKPQNLQQCLKRRIPIGACCRRNIIPAWICCIWPTALFTIFLARQIDSGISYNRWLIIITVVVNNVHLQYSECCLRIHSVFFYKGCWIFLTSYIP